LLEGYDFYSSGCKEKKEIPEKCRSITLERIGIDIGKPVQASNIINAEQILLDELANCGYPLAAIEKRDVIVDVAKKIVRVNLCIDIGPLCKFGPITMIGLKDVKTEFIVRKLLWEEGQTYDERLVEQTQRRLIETDLFTSLLISHADEPDASGQLPMKIRFSESKHRSISVGFSYATNDGFGLVFGWNNRNFRHMGEKLSLDVNINSRLTTGIASYMKPDFLRLNQNYLWQLEAMREKVTAYIADTYSLQNLLERYFSKRNYASIGLRGEFVDVTHSISNGTFTLLSLPIYYKFTDVRSILDPTSGVVANYWISPYQAVTHKKNTFLKQLLTASFYAPLSPGRWIVLAFRMQLGSILGTSLGQIPFSKRFLGGSDEDLRGYRYKTVSPLNSDGNPTGGRGALYLTVEPRFRITNSIGFIAFLDLGTVTDKTYPTVTGQWFKSVGFGLRYFTFFGPLRLDVGFPLDRRPFDPRYRVYASVGQTF
jgi:translocation and assembly module TamA